MPRSAYANARHCMTMASVALLAMGCAHAASAAPTASAPLGYDDARHLLARTGFGPTQVEIEAYAKLSRADAVTKLLRETRTSASTPPPASALAATPLRPPAQDATEADRKAFAQAQIREGLELRS